MTDFHVEVVQIERLERHDNADNLQIAHLSNGYSVVTQKDIHHKGDLVVYVPIDAVVPIQDVRFSWLKSARVRATRLRGILSEGFIFPNEGWSLGDHVHEQLGITKYQSPLDLVANGECEKDPGLMPVYDIEPLVKYYKMFYPGERVWISEKIHGANARFVHDGNRLWVGSHTKIKAEGNNMWWDIAKRYELDKILKEHPRKIVYGEIYGQVQDLTYGKEGTHLAVFDVMDIERSKHPSKGWFNPTQLQDFCITTKLPIVPTLADGFWGGLDGQLDDSYMGEWAERPIVRNLADGPSMVGGPMREGIVVKPHAERTDPYNGRVFFKLIGQKYRERKNQP